MKKITLSFIKVLPLIFIICLFSCKNGLIQEPSINSIISSTKSNEENYIKPPANIKASHGLTRQITLSWDSCDNAVQYFIYSAFSPYDVFEQIAETKGNATTITITENPGVSKYFLIKSIDSKGNLSSGSIIVYGSTLAVPIITEINEDENGTSSTVNWWMSNCEENTYANNIQYELHCYQEDKTTEVITPLLISDNILSATVNGLEPKTTYFYEVRAFINSLPDKSESSDKIDAQTAHLLIPLAPENLSIEKGINKDCIKISFDLPDYVDYKSSTNVYERHPLYFTIERKLLNDSDEKYQPIVTYLGTVQNDDNLTTDTIINFSCIENSPEQMASSSNLTIDTNNSDDIEISPNYEEYIPGSRLTYSDYNVEIGKQYSYRIKSFTDDSTSKISSEKSFAEEKGWLISNSELQVNADYQKSEDPSVFACVDVKFNSIFEDFNQPNVYTYVLTKQYAPFTESTDPTIFEPDEILLNTENLSSINKYVYHCDFSDSNTKKGYYKFKLYILKIGESDITNPNTVVYSEYESKNIITITDDATLFPQITTFEIDDGYKDKFILKWNYEENCSYIISYVQLDTAGTEIDQFSTQLSPEEAKNLVQEGFVIFEQEAQSDEIRKYTLTADAGLKLSKEYDEPVKTLGTAKLTMLKADYDKIVVSWPQVTNATQTYEISAKYKNSSITDELIITEGENKNTEITHNEETDIFTCTITNPAGFNDASISGSPVNFEVFAVSEKHPEEKTSSDIQVNTLGPALLNPQTNKNQINSDSIIVSWKNINDADGYIIQRIKYTDGKASILSPQSDKYYFDVKEKTLSINGEEISKDFAEINSTSETISLYDKYSVQKDMTSSYQSNQSQISWGIPFGYIIIPVKKVSQEDSPADDFIFDSTDTKTLTDESIIQYKNIQPAIGATKGFGLKVKANKADSAYIQTISWELPYYSNNTPVLYRRSANSTTNLWTKVSTSLQSKDTTVNYSPKDSDKYEAYEYIINYNTTAEIISVPESLIEDYHNVFDDERYNFGTNPKESINKGYLLNVPFSAKYNGKVQEDGSYVKDADYYSERVEWSAWDYSKRSIGPDSAEISIFNKNLSSGWQKVIDLDKNCYCSTKANLTDTTINTTSAENSTQMILTPAGIAAGTSNTTTGPLKVLRDAYHYYQLELKKGNSSQVVGANLDSTKENYNAVYAYRQITDEELSKAVMLIIADAFNQTDKGKTLSGNTGSFWWDTEYNAKIWRELRWKIANYNHIWKTDNIPSQKEITSFLTLADPNTNEANRGRESYGRSSLLGTDSSLKSNNCPYFLCVNGSSMKFDSSKLIPIQITSSIPLDSYKVTFNMATDDKTLNIVINHSDGSADYSKKIEGNDFKYWNPMKIEENSYIGKNTSYGWWN